MFQTFGDNLRRERMARGLTQERLAERDTGFQPVASRRALEHRLEARVTFGCDWKRLLG